MFGRSVDEVVGEPEAAHGDGAGGGIVEFDEFRWEAEVRGCEPFVDAEVAGEAEEDWGAVSLSDGRGGEGPCGTVGTGAAEAEVGRLGAEGEGVEEGCGVVVEVDDFAAFIEGEAGVEAGGVEVAVSVDDEEGIRGEGGAGREGEFGADGGVVCQGEAAEVDGCGGGVTDFDDVGEGGAVGVRGGVGGEDFVEDGSGARLGEGGGGGRGGWGDGGAADDREQV